MAFCPSCNAVSGQGKSGRTSSGAQRFLCSGCGRRYVEDDGRVYGVGHRNQIVAALGAGNSIRKVAQEYGVGIATVVRWKKWGAEGGSSGAEQSDVVPEPPSMKSAAQWLDEG